MRENRHVFAMKLPSAGRFGGALRTKMSTFLLSGRLACALMIFFSVPRGYSVCGISAIGVGFTAVLCACAPVRRLVCSVVLCCGVDAGVDVVGRARRVHLAGARCHMFHPASCLPSRRYILHKDMLTAAAFCGEAQAFLSLSCRLVLPSTRRVTRKMIAVAVNK